jgi:hypothetical protein
MYTGLFMGRSDERPAGYDRFCLNRNSVPTGPTATPAADKGVVICVK